METASISSSVLGTKTVSKSANSSWTTDSYSYTANAVYSTAYIVVNLSAGCSYKYSARISFTISKNGTPLKSESWNDDSWTRGTSWNYTITESLKAWDIISFSASISNSWWDQTSSLSWTIKIIWMNDVANPRVLIPQEIKNIGQQTSATSYWRLQDGSWYWDYDWAVSTSATTWNITLWNAVWYLTITGNDWTRYKIPIFWV